MESRPCRSIELSLVWTTWQVSSGLSVRDNASAGVLSKGPPFRGRGTGPHPELLVVPIFNSWNQWRICQVWIFRFVRQSSIFWCYKRRDLPTQSGCISGCINIWWRMYTDEMWVGCKTGCTLPVCVFQLHAFRSLCISVAMRSSNHRDGAIYLGGGGDP